MSSKNESFLKTIFSAFWWSCCSPDLRVGALFEQKNNFFSCYFRSPTFVSMLNDFGSHFDHSGEDLGCFFGNICSKDWANVPKGFCLFLGKPLTISQQSQRIPDHKPHTTNHGNIGWKKLTNVPTGFGYNNERLDKCSHWFLAHKSLAIQDWPGGSRAALKPE